MKKFKRSPIAIVCYVIAALLLVYFIITCNSVVGQINDYYASYGMTAGFGETIVYILQQGLTIIVSAILVFMAGLILEEVRKNNPANWRTVVASASVKSVTDLFPEKDEEESEPVAAKADEVTFPAAAVEAADEVAEEAVEEVEETAEVAEEAVEEVEEVAEVAEEAVAEVAEEAVEEVEEVAEVAAEAVEEVEEVAEVAEEAAEEAEDVVEVAEEAVEVAEETAEEVAEEAEDVVEVAEEETVELADAAEETEEHTIVMDSKEIAEALKASYEEANK